MADDEDLQLFVTARPRPDATMTLAEVLSSLGVPAMAADGADLGAPGWTVARVIGRESGVVYCAPTDVAEDGEITWDHLTAAVDLRVGPSAVAPVAEMGDQSIPKHRSLPLRSRASAGLVTQDRSGMYGALGAKAGVEYGSATVDGVEIVGLLGPPRSDDLEDETLNLFALSVVQSKPSLVLWRRGPIRGWTLLRKGKTLDEHWWDRTWTPVRPASAADDEDTAGWSDMIVDVLSAPVSEGAALAKAYRLSDEHRMHLRALLRRQPDDFAELVRLLGVPAVAAQVADGEMLLADIPGVRRHEHQSTWDYAMNASEDDPRWLQVLDDVQHRKPWWYVAMTAVCVLLGAAVAAAGIVEGSALWTILGVSAVGANLVWFVLPRARKASD